jgi:hypothetical protein
MDRLLGILLLLLVVGMVIVALRPPAEAPQTDGAPQAAGPATVLAAGAATLAGATGAAEAAPVADDGDCERRLSEMGAVFEPVEPIAEGECGAPRPLKVSAAGLPLSPAIVTRCEVALALATWTRHVLIPSAELHLGRAPSGLSMGDSYLCRDRRGDGSTKMSEHAFANAVDVMAVQFGEESVSVQPRAGTADAARAFQAAVRGGACAYFTTVLGPGADAAHDDHLHLDLIQRDSGYRMCQ